MERKDDETLDALKTLSRKWAEASTRRQILITGFLTVSAIVTGSVTALRWMQGQEELRPRVAALEEQVVPLQALPGQVGTLTTDVAENTDLVRRVYSFLLRDLCLDQGLSQQQCDEQELRGDNR